MTMDFLHPGKARKSLTARRSNLKTKKLRQEMLPELD
jgi:hypothetical protein